MKGREMLDLVGLIVSRQLHRVLLPCTGSNYLYMYIGFIFSFQFYR